MVFIEVGQMNSKQRRADRKAWRYEVAINQSRSFVDYDDMFDWCVTNFGNTHGIRRNGWREKHGHFGTCWQINDSVKAVAFAMRWK
jgi:hypothetical protein